MLFRFQERLGTPYDPEEQRDTFELYGRIDLALQKRLLELQSHLECTSIDEMIEKLVSKAVQKMDDRWLQTACLTTVGPGL